MKTSAIQTLSLALSRALLAILATVGLIVPTAAMPCCGCCSGAGGPNDAVSTCCSDPTCYSETSACCSAKSKPASGPCCVGQTDCDKPECRCNNLPVRAIPLSARPSIEKPSANEALSFASLSNRVPTVVSFDGSFDGRYLDHDAASHRYGTLRLHSWLCVWLN